MIRTIRGYQVVTSGTQPRCRYLPTCSQYAIEAVEVHGAFRGSWLALRRLGRCHPWGGTGYDPVPHANRCSDSGVGEAHAGGRVHP